jgi:hypothetical protein
VSKIIAAASIAALLLSCNAALSPSGEHWKTWQVKKRMFASWDTTAAAKERRKAHAWDEYYRRPKQDTLTLNNN